MKSYSHQANRNYPQWWAQYARKFHDDYKHKYARISFAKFPTGKQIINC